MITTSREVLRVAALSALVVGLASAAIAPALAHAIKSGDLVITHPWVRATPPGAEVTGGYLVIQNKVSEPDRLLGATAEVAGRVEIHETTMDGGVMHMRLVVGGVEVPAEGRLRMKPGGYHVMFLGLAHPLEEGTAVEGTLEFERAGSVAIEWTVGPMANPHEGGHGS